MAVINSTSFDGTANNTLFLGGIAANGFVNTTSIADYSNTSIISATYAPKASPTFTGNVVTSNLQVGGTTNVLNTIEKANTNTTALTGTINIDLAGNSIVYFTSNASANWTFNFRGNSSVTANSFIANNESATVAIVCTQGATAYYPNSHTVDGSAVTPKWQGGSAPTGGNANSVDTYTYTLIKTAANTYTVLAAQTQYK